MYERDFSTLIKPKIRKDVKPLTPMRYVYYLRLFAKKWVRKRLWQQQSTKLIKP